LWRGVRVSISAHPTMDDPVEYLRRAIECNRLSQTLPDAIARQTFAAMAKVWIKLAAELKRAAILDPDAHYAR
jgi:hypothetical protein